MALPPALAARAGAVFARPAVKVIGALALVIAVGGSIWYVTHLRDRVAVLVAEKAVVESDLLTCTATSKSLRGKIRKQNALISEMRRKAAEEDRLGREAAKAELAAGRDRGQAIVNDLGRGPEAMDKWFSDSFR